MAIAKIIAQRGTCSRLQVGAIISRGGRVISTGYNGAPSGLPHCNHDNDPPIGIISSIPIEFSPATRNILPGRIMEIPDITYTYIPSTGCKVAEHAERNAIAFAARYGLALEGAEIHTTHSPCLDCARSIINAGLTRVTFEIAYRLTDGVELLKQAGLEVVDMGNNEMVR